MSLSVDVGYKVRCVCGHLFLWLNTDLTKMRCPRCKKWLRKDHQSKKAVAKARPTPRPWRAKLYPDGTWGVRSALFAICTVIPQDEGETEANARLLASAPHLALQNKVLRKALAESVKLQSHYADLLNMQDTGHRLLFKNSAEWINRLFSTKIAGKVR